MRTNPFYDAYLFLTGTDAFHKDAGWQGAILVPVYWALLLASLYVARRVWLTDPTQRTSAHLWTWVIRVMIGTLWFEGSLWKLPLPDGGGFAYWVDEMGKYAAFGWHQALVANVYKPLLPIIHPLVFLTEQLLAASFILGLGVRLFGIIGVLFTLHIYLGLYHLGSEWPWSYISLAFVQAFFVIEAAGRSLGLDALLRPRLPAEESSEALSLRLYRLAS